MSSPTPTATDKTAKPRSTLKSRIPIALIAIAGAALVVLLVYGVLNQSPSRTLDEAIAGGQHPVAPDITQTLPSLSGSGGTSLAAFHGKVVLLDFWASWCIGCQDEGHLLEHLQRKLERHNATVLGVTYQDASTDSRRFVHEYGLSYPILRDANGEFVRSFGTRQLPENFLINRKGHLVDIERGPVSKAFVNRALALAAKES